jgi:hypothetical protein
MPPWPESIITVLGAFVALFSRPVWCHAQLVLVGAILCRGPHTVTAVLRVMGLGGERRRGEDFTGIGGSAGASWVAAAERGG